MEQGARLGDKCETIIAHYANQPKEVVHRGGDIISIDCPIGANQGVVRLCRQGLEAFSWPQAIEASLLASGSNHVHMPSSVTKGGQPAKEENALCVVDRPW